MTKGTEPGNDVVVSIIVPVFNVATFLEEGLQSIIDQYYRSDLHR